MRRILMLTLALFCGACALDDPALHSGEGAAAPPVVDEATAEPAAPAEPAEIPPPAPPEVFGRDYVDALGLIGLTPATARCSPSERRAFQRGPFATSLYEALQGDPTLCERYADVFRRGSLGAAARLEPLSMLAAGRVDATVRRTLLGDPMAEELKTARVAGALDRTLAELSGAPAGNPMQRVYVPAELEIATTLILRGADRARRFHELAVGKQDRALRALLREKRAETVVLHDDESDDDVRRAFEACAGATDLGYLARGHAEILLAVDRAVDVLTGRDGSGGDRAAGEATRAAEVRASLEAWPARGASIETPLGLVVLGEMDERFLEGPVFLRIALYGDDVHRGGGAAADGLPVGVLIDLGGDDRYEAAPDQRAFGSGVYGYGVLVDVAGNDHYVLPGKKSVGLGAGAFGCGALLDMAGDDRYEGHSFTQGAATVGTGVLADLSGDDSYEAYSYCQGFGFVRGCGMLVDVTGADAYVGNDTDIVNPSPQSKEHNVTLGQGFGYGLRADYLDGHSLAGGVGLLVDGAGDDVYSCGVFGQGGAYWMGTGMLLDGGGDDSYTGVWYVQGATAHFAVGLLEDVSGDDRYVATMNMAQGAGHDFSLGVLIDRAGDDVHEAPNLSLGGGNANGVGIFVDLGGDDTYTSRGTTLGLAKVATPANAPSLRHGALSLGVFLDLGGGDDGYFLPGDAPEPLPQAFAGNDTTWTHRDRVKKPSKADERGVGMDR